MTLLFTIHYSLFTSYLYAGAPNKINYQGRLRQNGQPVTGTRTMQYKLYDVITGGSALWTSSSYDAVVSTGVYSVIVNMPTTLNWATGEYYLEVIVGGTTLSPREQLTSAVYSIYSGDSDKLDGRDYTAYVSTRAENQTLAGVKTFSGNVGIGNSSPVGMFQVGAGTLTVLSNGNVGIGTTGPGAKLHVYGTAAANMAGISSIALPTSGDEIGVFTIKTNHDSTMWGQSIVSYSTTGKGLRVYNEGSGAGETAFEVVQAGGSRLIVDQAGNVGIGTTGPGRPLSVVSMSGGNTISLLAYSPTTAGTVSVDFMTQANRGLGSQILGSNTNTGELAFYTNGGVTLGLYQNYLGNVGIGTASPADLLDIQGNNQKLRFSDVNDNEAFGLWHEGNSGSGKLYIVANNDYDAAFTTAMAKVTIQQDGNVGIGTTNAVYPLTTTKTGTSYGISNVLGIASFEGPLSNESGIILGYRTDTTEGTISPTEAANSLGFYTYDSGWYHRLKIATNGNVGIGTTSPQSRLHVKRDTNKHFVVRAGSDQGDGRAGVMLQGLDDTYSGNMMTIAGSPLVLDGNVGIGLVGPEGRLHVLSNSTSDKYVFVTSHTVSGYGLVVSTSGNVGIGTTNPATYKLEVVGNASKTVGGTTWVDASDRRLKNELGEVSSVLDKINKLRPIKYKWNDLRIKEFGESDKGVKFGFIAQEMKEVFPEFISEGKKGFLMYNPSGYEAILTAAIQEQQKEIEELKLKIEDLRLKIEKN